MTFHFSIFRLYFSGWVSNKTWIKRLKKMGAGVSSSNPFDTVEAAIAGGKTQEEIDAYLQSQDIETKTSTFVQPPLHDPWLSLPISKQLQFLHACDTSDDTINTPSTKTILNGENITEALMPLAQIKTLKVIMEESTITKLKFPNTCTSNVVSLSYAQGALTQFLLESKNILRQLNLSGCPLNVSTSNLITFSSQNLSSLLILDLSFTEFSSIDSLDFSQLSQLRRLDLESCSLESLQYQDKEQESPLQDLLMLEYLNISDNEFSEIEQIKVGLLSINKTLIELDFRDNELKEEMGRHKYRKLMTEEIFKTGSLTTLDNKLLVAVVGSTKMLSQTKGIRDAVTSDSEVVKANEDRGSCSCLAGNACDVAYNCKDWKNRYKIAKEVRKIKGMEEIPGLS